MLAERELVSQGLPVVQSVSKRLALRLGGRVTCDDLTGLGNLALLEVARTWDPARATFEAYAARRLRWAILDGLRRETHGRTVAARATALIASERLSDEHEREPESEEPTTIEEDQAALGALLEGHAAALATGLLTARPEIEGVNELTPEEAVGRAEAVYLARRVIQTLPEPQRTLMDRHYNGGEAFDVIARDLNFTKSWASRLHKRSLDTLRVALMGKEEEPAPEEEAP